LIIDLLEREGRHIEEGWVKDIPMGRKILNSRPFPLSSIFQESVDALRITLIFWVITAARSKFCES